MSKTIKVYNEQITKEWRKLFGTDELPIKSVIPHIIETTTNFCNAFMLDIDKLTKKQVDALTKYLLEQTHLDAGEIKKDVVPKGVPILIDENSQYKIYENGELIEVET